jgi:hypothetical protein
MVLTLNELPSDILALIWHWVPFTIVRRVCRKTHEQRNAEKNTPTGPAHCIHIAIQRFHWRWITPLTLRELQETSRPLGCDKTISDSTTRELSYINWTLRFHSKWTGPAIPYKGYVYNRLSVAKGVYNGSQ